MSMKNSNDTIGNRTRDLPTCTAVPQPTSLPHAPTWCSISCNTSTSSLKKKIIAQKVYTARTRTSYKTALLTNLNKYLHSDTSEMEMNINIRANSVSSIFL